VSATTNAAAVSAALFAAVLLAGPSQAELDLGLRKVERVHLDDVWPSPDGKERITELYIRALTRYDEPVEDLGPPDFEITDAGDRIDKEDIEIGTVSGLGRGVTCVIAIDVSRTMSGKPFARAKAAAEELMELLEGRDRVAVVAFANEVNVVAPFSAAKADAKMGIEGLTIDEESLATVLYDGVDQAIRLIRERDGLPRRTFMIVFSDGNDTGSRRSLEQVIDNARGSETNPPVLIYTIGYSRFGGEGIETLKRLSERTGADSHLVRDTTSLTSFFRAIWLQMQKSYVVRYPADMDDELHKVEIEVEGLTSSRTAKYPWRWPSEWFYFGVGILVLLVALVAWLMVNRGRIVGRLVFENGPRSGEVAVIRRMRTSIGALPDNDIVIGVDTVSKYHVLIFRKGRELEIEDQNSKNGTYVNGIRVRTSPLQPGDRIRIADIDLIYQR
jgi:Mg-chelatase subunit ChlD